MKKQRKKLTGAKYFVGSLILGGVAFYVIPASIRYYSSYAAKIASQKAILNDDSDSGPVIVKRKKDGEDTLADQSNNKSEVLSACSSDADNCVDVQLESQKEGTEN